MPEGCLFDMAGPAIFHPNDDEDSLLAWMVLLNSQPARLLLNAMNPSLHYQVRDVRNLPLPMLEPDDIGRLATLGRGLRDGCRETLHNDQADILGLRELEVNANELVCELYGVLPTGRLPIHHALKRRI